MKRRRWVHVFVPGCCRSERPPLRFPGWQVRANDVTLDTIRCKSGVVQSDRTRMTSRYVNPNPGLRPVHLAVAILAALIPTADHAAARNVRSERSVQAIES